MVDSQDSATDLKLGTRVRSADGEFLGEVKEIERQYTASTGEAITSHAAG